MAILQFVSTRPLAGKTTAAVTFARGLAEAGANVQLVRLGVGDGASEDATAFLEHLFATTSGKPATVPGLMSIPRETLAIVELDGAATPLPDAPSIIAVRGEPTDEDKALASSLGDRLIGTVAVDVMSGQVENVARNLTNGGLRPLAVVPEDRALSAPSVGEIRSALDATVLYEGENDNVVVEDVLIAPVYADPAQPHFRRFGSKAVLAPFNKTDLHLAAIETNAACLVITGGHDPSPYVVDRAQHGETTVLLARRETPETLAALGDVWFTSRFRGQRKLDAIARHLEGRIDYATLLRRLQG